eukprot:UN10695
MVLCSFQICILSYKLYKLLPKLKSPRTSIIAS